MRILLFLTLLLSFVSVWADQSVQIYNKHFFLQAGIGGANIEHPEFGLDFDLNNEVGHQVKIDSQTAWGPMAQATVGYFVPKFRFLPKLFGDKPAIALGYQYASSEIKLFNADPGYGEFVRWRIDGGGRLNDFQMSPFALVDFHYKNTITFNHVKVAYQGQRDFLHGKITNKPEISFDFYYIKTAIDTDYSRLLPAYTTGFGLHETLGTRYYGVGFGDTFDFHIAPYTGIILGAKLHLLLPVAHFSGHQFQNPVVIHGPSDVYASGYQHPGLTNVTSVNIGLRQDVYRIRGTQQYVYLLLAGSWSHWGYFPTIINSTQAGQKSQIKGRVANIGTVTLNIIVPLGSVKEG